MKHKDLTAGAEYALSTRTDWTYAGGLWADRVRLIETDKWAASRGFSGTMTTVTIDGQQFAVSGRRDAVGNRVLVAYLDKRTGAVLRVDIVSTGHIRAPWAEAAETIAAAQAAKQEQEKAANARAAAQAAAFDDLHTRIAGLGIAGVTVTEFASGARSYSGVRPDKPWSATIDRTVLAALVDLAESAQRANQAAGITG